MTPQKPQPLKKYHPPVIQPFGSLSIHTNAEASKLGQDGDIGGQKKTRNRPNGPIYPPDPMDPLGIGSPFEP